MQVQAVVTHFAASLGFANISDGLAVVEEQGYIRLLFSSRSDSRLGSILLAEGQAASGAPPTSPVIGAGAGEDIVVQDTTSLPRIFVFSSYDGPMRYANMAANGTPGLTKGISSNLGSLNGVTAMEVFERGATDIAIIAQKDVAGLSIFSLDDAGYFTLTATVQDGPKSYLGDVTDMVGLTVAGRSFLLVSSALENGVTCYEVESNGTLSFVDALGARDGLPVAGPAAMQSAQIGGQTFVVLASTLSSSLTVLRVNPMGVLFEVDHIVDDLTSRFFHTAALDMFTYNGRVFIVAAGTDSGLSVLELLPDGQLSHMLALPLETGAGIAVVTGIETTMIGNVAAILLTDARGDRIHQFAMNMVDVGGLITGQGGPVAGSALDDRIFGTAGAETIQGGAGDDYIHDGGGNDLLYGGAGGDVFVMTRDNSADRIADFQDGTDRIDLGDWGRIYSASALSIVATSTGAIVSYGAESLTITNAAGGSLTLTDADFLF